MIYKGTLYVISGKKANGVRTHKVQTLDVSSPGENFNTRVHGMCYGEDLSHTKS